MTPVNTRALLLILKKIENNTEVEANPPSMIKPIGAEGKYKMESINSHIPKRSKQVGFRANSVLYARNMALQITQPS